MAGIGLLDSLSFWLEVGLYALAAIGYVLGTVLVKPALLRRGRLVALAGLCANALNVVVHWIRVGHGPYLGRVEVLSSTAWVVVAAFLIVQRYRPALNSIGGAVLTVIFLGLGAVGLTSGLGDAEIPLYYRSGWLVIHIVFAQLYVAFAVLAAGLGAFHLSGKRLSGRLASLLPPAADIDALIYRFTLLGFVFLTVMILSGSIWANAAWGSYWSWDPIEVWSLIAWLIAAIELHLIRTYNWRGRNLALLSVISLGVGLFAIFGSVIIFPTIHSYYMVK